MKALLIGESWGRNEHDHRHAFVGTSGQELARMGGESGLFPELLRSCKFCMEIVPFGKCPKCGIFNSVSFLEMVHFWAKTRNYGVGLTNVFHEHPESDNVELFFGGRGEDVNTNYGPYQRGARRLYILNSYTHYLERLYDEINTLHPNLLILLGNTACWAVLGQTKISDLRGTIQNTKFGIKALPTFHPASIIGPHRNWANRPIIVADLKKAARESQTPTINRTKLWFQTNPTLAEIEQWFADSDNKLFAVDIESGFVLYSKSELDQMKKYSPKARGLLAQMISMVGFAKSNDQALVIPFLKRNEIDGSLERYWESKSDEFRAWQWTQYGLSTGAELVFQNGMYDVNRLLCVGMRPRNMRHDTMLLQHSMLPEMLKSLGFLASIHLDGVSSWKTMYGQGESLKRDD